MTFSHTTVRTRSLWCSANAQENIIWLHLLPPYQCPISLMVLISDCSCLPITTCERVTLSWLNLREKDTATSPTLIHHRTE